jgi:predicted DsbA family dithiol-disulfide isomerase
LETLKETQAVEIVWRSFELRPREAPPISPEYKAKIMASRPQLYAHASQHYGLELNQGPFGIDSRDALIGAKYAEAQGVGEAYHQAVFDAYWLEGRNVEDHEVLAAIAAGIGLEQDAFLAALKSEKYLAEVMADIAQARTYGLSGVPAPNPL